MSRSIQDSLDNNYSISITYLPTNNTVSFSGYVEGMKDSYTLNWNTDEVYGRIDPIYTYKSTTRKVNISFHVPSESLGDAKANFKKLQTLLTFSYPVYEKESILRLGVAGSDELATRLGDSGIPSADKMASGNAMLLSRPPLVSIKFANLISSDTIDKKLVGKYNEINYEYDQDQGVYSENGKIIPKYFKVSIELDVIHTADIGWEIENNKVLWKGKGSKYPYGV